ncbi:GL15048 [Drosophila persimilis]|uniref:GL15048 n=1 Tax=Drosophila persimilis TaxID=7234 RepID=B4HAY6_DROPE|nr:GL15048 [Drosophila persimilis]
MRTSYKKNRPFDFKLINLVEPHPVLYRRSGLSTYDAMKAKTDIWTQIAKIMGCDVDFLVWEEYNDGRGIDLENSYIIEEIIEEASDEVMHEEIIYEDIEEHKINSSESDKQQMVGSPICPRSYFFKMDEILDQFKQPQRQRAERRIMAFLLKCQLRSLHNQPVDDLVI